MDNITVTEWDRSITYKKGDRVLFNGVVFENMVNNNNWSPFEYILGWRADK